ncbi:GNAT family N-acetyltransferase [Agaribacter flavus]|uniref:GNAT family N-acetyltransferase n=1 Tax=Agaribacter flavus TaxID=1902781 RepID=A0ABV7FK22_9ALTE
MKIRPFEQHDLPQIFEIYAQSKLDELRFEEGEFVLIRLEEDPKRFPKVMESNIFVYEDGIVLGFGAILKSEIRALFVAPSARGRGIGKSLLECLLAKSLGNTSLWVTRSNIPAIQLYKSYGFVISDEFYAKYNGKAVSVCEMHCRD